MTVKDIGINHFVGVNPPVGDYNELTGKPAIDGVTLTSTTTKADLGLDSAFIYAGQVSTYNDLPKSNNKKGDTWNVADTGENYTWSGNDWDKLTGRSAVYFNNNILESASMAIEIDSTKNKIKNLTKTDVGLNNVDNTSDINKPVSTKQSEAIKTVQDDLNSKFTALNQNIEAETAARTESDATLTNAISDMETKTHASETYQPKGDYETTSSVNTKLEGKQDKLTAGTNITITNNVISATGGSGMDNNGLEGDYCSKYGIVDETVSGLPYQGTGNQVVIPASLVLDVPGVPGLTTNASKITHDLVSTTDCELFLAQGTVIEATEVYWQISEPEDGQSGYLAWWNGEKWQFKSNDTGNVWRDANAVRIAKCIFTSGSLTRLCFTGCRLLNKQEYAVKNDMEMANNEIETLTSDMTTAQSDIGTIKTSINNQATLISNLQDEKVDKTSMTTYDTEIATMQTNITTLQNNDTDLGNQVQTLQGTVNTLNTNAALKSELPSDSSLMLGTVTAVSNIDSATVTDVAGLITSINSLLATLRTRGVIS